MGGLYSLPISRSPMWAPCGGQIFPLRTVLLSALYWEQNDIMVIRNLFEQFLVRKCYLIFGRINPLSIVRPRQAGKIGIHLSRSAGAEDGQLGHFPICVGEFHGSAALPGAVRRGGVLSGTNSGCSVGFSMVPANLLTGQCLHSGGERIRRVRQLILECVPLKMVSGDTFFFGFHSRAGGVSDRTGMFMLQRGSAPSLF